MAKENEIHVKFAGIEKAPGGPLSILYIPDQRQVLLPGVRYRIVLEGISFEEKEVGEKVEENLSVIQAERCPLLVSAIFGLDYRQGAKVSQLNELREACITCMSLLTLREQGILIHRLGLDGSPTETLKEVGIRYKVTTERIRQIETKALRKMRHPSRSRLLKDYLD